MYYHSYELYIIRGIELKDLFCDCFDNGIESEFVSEGWSAPQWGRWRLEIIQLTNGIEVPPNALFYYEFRSVNSYRYSAVRYRYSKETWGKLQSCIADKALRLGIQLWYRKPPRLIKERPSHVILPCNFSYVDHETNIRKFLHPFHCVLYISFPPSIIHLKFRIFCPG